MEIFKIIGTTQENETETITATSFVNAQQIGMIKMEMGTWVGYKIEK